MLKIKTHSWSWDKLQNQNVDLIENVMMFHLESISVEKNWYFHSSQEVGWVRVATSVHDDYWNMLTFPTKIMLLRIHLFVFIRLHNLFWIINFYILFPCLYYIKIFLYCWNNKILFKNQHSPIRLSTQSVLSFDNTIAE